MPYTAKHKQQTQEKIIETARILFNRKGYHNVTIDMVMESAGLTRGGFYNHFKNKDALFSAAVSSFLMGRGARWRDEAGIDLSELNPQMASQMIDAYLSSEHLGDVDGQCPMIALPSDVARANTEVQESYKQLLDAMVWLFERSLAEEHSQSREKALAMSALCVGGMVLARTLPDSELANEVRNAAHKAALDFIGNAVSNI